MYGNCTSTIICENSVNRNVVLHKYRQKMDIQLHLPWYTHRDMCRRKYGTIKYNKSDHRRKYLTAIPQCFAAVSPACLNNVSPTSDTVGTIVSGVIIFNNFPTNPVKPMTNWKTAETAIAPDISRIRNCHNSVRSAADIAFNVSVFGHFHCGRFKIASTGTRNEIVPPCFVSEKRKSLCS